MGRFTENMTATLDAIALRKYVLALPRDEYLAYIDEHPDFKSSDAQVFSDSVMLTMKVVDESMGKDAAIAWAHRRYWQGVGAAWRAENLAQATSRLTAFGLTFLFNGAKYGAVLAVAYLAMPLPYFAGFLPVFSVIVLGLSVCGAVLRKIL